MDIAAGVARRDVLASMKVPQPVVYVGNGEPRDLRSEKMFDVGLGDRNLLLTVYLGSTVEWAALLQIRRLVYLRRAALLVIDDFEELSRKLLSDSPARRLDAVLSSLGRTAHMTGSAVLILSKRSRGGGKEKDTDARLIAESRSVLEVLDHPEIVGIHVVRHLKSNLGPLGPGWEVGQAA